MHARLPRSTGVSILGLLPWNYLQRFTSCFIRIWLVTKFVTPEAPRLTRSAQVEPGRPNRVSIQGGSTKSAP